jgi:hypothetical protein
MPPSSSPLIQRIDLLIGDIGSDHQKAIGKVSTEILDSLMDINLTAIERLRRCRQYIDMQPDNPTNGNLLYAVIEFHQASLKALILQQKTEALLTNSTSNRSAADLMIEMLENENYLQHIRNSHPDFSFD